jgi:hypothetical protein
MALERFIAEHLRIAATLVGVPCERMTALEILLEDNRYQIAEATRIADHAEAVNDFNGTYTGIIAILNAIGDKRGVDYNDGINAAEQVEYMDDDEVFERANDLLAEFLEIV